MQSFTIPEDDARRRTHRVFICDDLHLVKSVMQPGYWMVTEYPAAVVTRNLTSKHVFVSGRFTETTGAIPDRVAGSMTSEDDTPIQPGRYRRETPEGCELWCVRNHLNQGGNVNHVAVVALEQGGQTVAEQGQNIFVLEGGCTASGVALQAEKLYKVTTGPKTVVAQTKAYLLVWTPQQQEAA